MNICKKMCLLMISLCCAFLVRGQVLNPGFELLRADSSLANWESTLLIVLSADSMPGNCPSDSIYFRTDDAHSGKSALEIRNVRCNGGVAYGKIFATDDIPSFGPSQPFTARPAFFSFYYKSFPVEGDGFRITIQLLDTNGLSVAAIDSVVHPVAVTAYTLVTLPLTYERTSTPSRLLMHFSITDATGGTGNMHAGSRLLIDDIATGGTTGIQDRYKEGSRLKCYPTVAPDILHLTLENSAAVLENDIALINMEGRVLKKWEQVVLAPDLTIKVRDLPAGTYLVRVTNAAGCYTARFIH